MAHEVDVKQRRESRKSFILIPIGSADENASDVDRMDVDKMNDVKERVLAAIKQYKTGLQKLERDQETMMEEMLINLERGDNEEPLLPEDREFLLKIEKAKNSFKSTAKMIDDLNVSCNVARHAIRYHNKQKELLEHLKLEKSVQSNRDVFNSDSCLPTFFY